MAKVFQSLVARVSSEVKEVWRKAGAQMPMGPGCWERGCACPEPCTRQVARSFSHDQGYCQSCSQRSW
ncbi:hypothetical protein GDO81_021105 [Engystomops pustulosus]|uniref:Uncharacterized protein n=1 Tax=Engystomops pustulosus TaxID=76066 RepID=A0AAV6YQ71_ENGPU|nr:hypothetical protein GDO81_021105 [Engystomops pustulosus]